MTNAKLISCEDEKLLANGLVINSKKYRAYAMHLPGIYVTIRAL